MKQIIFLPIATALFFILAVFQNSFATPLIDLPAVPNLVFIVFFIIIFFQDRPGRYWGAAYALAAGLCIDLFSLAGGFLYIGPAIVACLAAWGVVASSHYFLQERQTAYLPLYFLIVFSIGLSIYLAIRALAGDFFVAGHWVFTFWQFLLFLVIYEVVAVAGFYVGRFFMKDDRQLSLL